MSTSYFFGVPCLAAIFFGNILNFSVAFKIKGIFIEGLHFCHTPWPPKWGNGLAFLFSSVVCTETSPRVILACSLSGNGSSALACANAEEHSDMHYVLLSTIRSKTNGLDQALQHPRK